jgi:hypothetical protein
MAALLASHTCTTALAAAFNSQLHLVFTTVCEQRQIAITNILTEQTILIVLAAA